MKDYSELKRLAEAAKRSGEENGERWPQDDDWFEPDRISDEMVFVKAVSPTNVLALIAELENLRGCDTAYAEVWEKARALQSEMDEVRQDAARYRWLIDHAEEIYVCNQNLHLDPHYWGAEKVKQEADQVIDLAMQQETK